MKVVVAMDSFKGTLSAVQACEAVARGLGRVRPGVEVVVKPMADGGEGTAAALVAATGGAWIEREVMGPLPTQKVRAGYGWLPDQEEAVIEMAAASGLTLLTEHERDPLKTTTYGTGQLMADAIQRGARCIRLAVGGSATVDGGVGAATALGWRFLDESGQAIGLGGGALSDLRALRAPEGERPEVIVLCDVNNPLCGPEGAAAVYGPQKGATAEMVERLERGLRRVADCVERELGIRIADVPGGGAAGGLAAGALAFMRGRLVPGIDAVMSASRLAEAVAGADWLVTGEGRFDSQSLRGKVVSGMVKVAREMGARVAVLAGQVELPPGEARAFGVAAVEAAAPRGMPPAEAFARAEPLLEAAAERLALARMTPAE